jgi:EAL domain-containing protein (putative c-di-GMP-specific phosphodiesterase class I)
MPRLGRRRVTIVVAARLELEITESVLLGNHRAVFDALLRVRELGVRVSMDDFGIGY